MNIFKEITVDASRRYNVIVGQNLLENAAALISEAITFDGAFIIADENAYALYANKLSPIADAHYIIIKSGESSKNCDNYTHVCNQILALKPNRKSLIVALGGGVAGDLAGFVASTMLRGVGFVQIPTTVLAMVDSSVGGKNGINTAYGKNLIGTFYQPALVLADINTLKTLPKREILAGYAEIIKYGLIDNPAFFTWCEQNAHRLLNNDSDILSQAISTSVESKARIVAADEKESGARMLLNLGHTFGHALEAFYGYDGTILHGEAVAIGMAMAFRYSEYIGLCEDGAASRISLHMQAVGLASNLSSFQRKPDASQMLDYMLGDKKAGGGYINLILAENIGKSVIYKESDFSRLTNYLKQELANAG